MGGQGAGVSTLAGREAGARAANGSLGEEEAGPLLRPRARGKFLWAGDEKLWVKGVSYGTFRPDESGQEFHDASRVATDLQAMAAAGINAVRTYTVPPSWLLDAAAERGLRVLVGLPWEQHVTFLDDRRRAASIVRRVQGGARACALAGLSDVQARYRQHQRAARELAEELFDASRVLGHLLERCFASTHRGGEA